MDSLGNRGNTQRKPYGTKMIGKPDSGKPTVRFDEGELEIELNGHYASSLLY